MRTKAGIKGPSTAAITRRNTNPTQQSQAEIAPSLPPIFAPRLANFSLAIQGQIECRKAQTAKQVNHHHPHKDCNDRRGQDNQQQTEPKSANRPQSVGQKVAATRRKFVSRVPHGRIRSLDRIGERRGNKSRLRQRENQAQFEEETPAGMARPECCEPGERRAQLHL